MNAGSDIAVCRSSDTGDCLKLSHNKNVITRTLFVMLRCSRGDRLGLWLTDFLAHVGVVAGLARPTPKPVTHILVVKLPSNE